MSENNQPPTNNEQPAEKAPGIRLNAAQQRNFDAMFDAIVKEPASGQGRLPEHLFLKYFLPVFANQRPAPEDFISTWVSIAGQPAGEVQIVDNANNVLFTVPPLMDTHHIKRLRPDGSMDFSSIGQMLALHAQSNPKLAEANYQQNLIKRYKESHSPTSVTSENQKRWQEIFVRYGIEQTKPEPAQAASAKSTGAEDDIGDDEFVQAD